MDSEFLLGLPFFYAWRKRAARSSLLVEASISTIS
jgi:hypothetical protein